MNLFKRLVWDNLVEAAFIELYAAFPFLKVPPISWIIEPIIKHFLDAFYAGVSLFIVTEMIPIRNEALKVAYDREAVKLKIIAKNHGIESQEFLDAREKSKVGLSKFVRTRAA